LEYKNLTIFTYKSNGFLGRANETGVLQAPIIKMFIILNEKERSQCEFLGSMENA